MGRNKYSGWLAGCGLGCAGVIVVVVAIGVIGYLSVRKTVDQFQNASRTVSQVDEEFGRAQDFTPEADGRIPAERIQSFLAVREATRVSRERIAGQVANLETAVGKEGVQEKGFWHTLSVIRTGAQAVPAIADFQQERARALLANHMGTGEYYYIYTLSYYSLLKKDPGDGPRFLRSENNNGITWKSDSDPVDAREGKRAFQTRRVRDLFRPILKNALRVGQETGAAEKSPWLQSVEQELTALDTKRSRIPWEDDLPKEIASSLEPFRMQLEKSYDPTTNFFEILDFEGHGHR